MERAGVPKGRACKVRGCKARGCKGRKLEKDPPVTVTPSAEVICSGVIALRVLSRLDAPSVLSETMVACTVMVTARRRLVERARAGGEGGGKEGGDDATKSTR